MEYNILSQFEEDYDKTREEEMTLTEYLALCKSDHMVYASAAERMLAAIGEPEYVDTARDPRLSRIFLNRIVKVYPAFAEFYGMETTIENIVSYFKHSAQSLEEKKQILYLLGPVGGGKSSLAERLKALMEKFPIYALKTDEHGISPIFESPLGLFNPEKYADALETNYGIARRYLTGLMSPWAVKRLKEFDGNISKFKVVKLYPSKLKQIAVSKTEPGDENNQDISSLVGKVDIRMLERFSQNDTDAYSYSGGLCRANQGIMEFVEMFKAPIKVLHPLLTATQEGNYNGTEAIAAIPFQGIILAHSNESEWIQFKANRNNEAFLDRIYIVKVPYCLRVSEEIKIYDKLVSNSSLINATTAPKTLEMMAQFAILTRLKEHENSNLWSKMRVYNGEDLKDTDPHAKSIQEYRDTAGVDEGMSGMSTRFAFKILSRVYNYDPEEVAANPVHLMFVMEDAIRKEQFGPEVEQKYLSYIKQYLQPKYQEFIEDELQKAYLESYDEYGQNLFIRYVTYADMWLQDQEFRDPDTGTMLNREALNSELSKIEKVAGISNPKDFRHDVVQHVLRERAKNGGKDPIWTNYTKIKTVIEKKMFAQTTDLLPVISFGKKSSSEEEKKHNDFVERMKERGYTAKQVRLLVDWYMRVRKSS